MNSMMNSIWNSDEFNFLLPFREHSSAHFGSAAQQNKFMSNYGPAVSAGCWAGPHIAAGNGAKLQRPHSIQARCKEGQCCGEPLL